MSRTPISFESLLGLAVALNATTPVPAGYPLIWSTVTNCVLVWNGSNWVAAGGVPQSITDTTSTGTVNNYAPTGFSSLTNKISIVNSLTITGISSTGFIDGQRLILVARSAATLTITQLDSGSMTANQFACPESQITPGTGAEFVRDNGVWVPI